MFACLIFNDALIKTFLKIELSCCYHRENDCNNISFDACADEKESSLTRIKKRSDLL
jgi:hypothetical protein